MIGALPRPSPLGGMVAVKRSCCVTFPDMGHRPTPTLLFLVLCTALWSSSSVAIKTCDSVASAVAKGVAGASCDSVKEACGVSLAYKARTAFDASLDLGKCCKTVIVGCRSEAKTIPCEVSGDKYGSCTPGDFIKMYLELVHLDCKDTVCLDNACKDKLTKNNDDDDDDDDDGDDDDDNDGDDNDDDSDDDGDHDDDDDDGDGDDLVCA